MSIRRAGIRHVRAPDVRGSPGPCWPPTNLPGCVAWYDMLETYTESGGTVTAIRNMVTGSDAMAEATNPPALSAINGRKCIIGDATDDLLSTTEAPVVAAFNGPVRSFTVSLVLQATSPPSAATNLVTVFGAASSAVQNIRAVAVQRLSVSGWRLAGASDGGFTHASQALPPSMDPQVVTFVCAPYGWEAYLNRARIDSGAWVGTGFDGQITATRVAFLCRRDATADRFSPDKAGCALVFDRPLSQGSVLGLHETLLGRWGIP